MSSLDAALSTAELLELETFLDSDDVALDNGRVGQVGQSISTTSIKHCAALLQGDRQGEDQALVFMREHRSSRPASFLTALLRSNRMDEAAKIVIERLESSHGRGDMLYRMQDYPVRPKRLPSYVLAHERWTLLMAREDVRAVLDHYRPHIPVHPDWPEMPLGKVCRFIDYRGKTPQKTAFGIPLITAKNVRQGYISPEPREFIAGTDYDSWMTRGIPQAGDVLFTTEAPLGNVAEITITERFALAQRLIALCPNREVLIGGFLKDVLLSGLIQDKIRAYQSGTTVYGIKASVLKDIHIPVPPLATQQTIVAEIEAEQALVAANCELITRFEQKIKTTLARIWGGDA